VDATTLDQVRTVVREISTAAKALRLYPPSSPMPRQSAASAAHALTEYLATAPVLSLEVVKEGFRFAGEDLGLSGLGAGDLSGLLQSHGVAELSFVPGCTTEELIAFLTGTLGPPEEVREAGGLAMVMAAAGVERIRISEVALTVAEGAMPAEDQDVEQFLRDLASDSSAFGTWLAAAVENDPAAVEESLAELASVVGDAGRPALVESLADAFREHDETRDTLLALALGSGDTSDLVARLFPRLGVEDVASSVCASSYGENMMSLSTALTELPIADRFGPIMAQIREMLPEYGHSEREQGFLDHMIEVKRSRETEEELTSVDPSFAEMAQEARVTRDEMDSMLAEIGGSRDQSLRVAARTLLSLLDQQQDFTLYCRTLDTLAAMVPQLVGAGDLESAKEVLEELSLREQRADQPWPELTDHLREAMARATDGTVMSSLIDAVAADPTLASDARSIVQAGGDTAPSLLVKEALGGKERGLDVAEQILGRRMYDVLPALVTRVQWFQVAPLARRLSDHGDQRAMQALKTLSERSDTQTRREVATGLGHTTNAAAVPIMAELVRDPAPEVCIASVRALGRCGLEGSAAVLASRLREIDADGKDFVLAKEIVTTLAGVQDPEAADALQRLAGRRALIKRGHFAEIQALAKDGLKAQRRAGGGA
jgi:hypothetical protein